MRETILVIDDESDMLENCERVLGREGYCCVALKSAEGLTEILKKESPDLVLTDLKMPGKDGMEVLREVKAAYPDVAVLLFTAFATVETAVAAIKEGAHDYIPKPFSNDQLLIAIDKALRERRLKKENIELRQKLGLLYGLDKIVGTSPKLRGVLELVKKVAPTEANILIVGESGTGKELIARVIHLNSKRKDGPFVPVDCASLPEHLLESELFGHEKGAFTDAHGARPGIFEYANGGTIFLDEIGDMPLSLQAKLFRVLQERQVRRLGANRLTPVDVRIISATNKDLKKEVEAKRFREELYFRLNVITLQLPPLREREGDVALLAKHFLSRFGAAADKKIRSISPRAMKALEGYLWSGNVRELQNIIERAVTLAETDAIVEADLPESLLKSSLSSETSSPLSQDLGEGSTDGLALYKEAKKQKLFEFDKKYLEALLAKHGGNVSRAADEAGIDRKTIHRMIGRYGLEKAGKPEI